MLTHTHTHTHTHGPVADLDGKAGGEAMASAESELIMNGVLGTVLPVGSRGKAPEGGKGTLPPEAERIFIVND